MKALLALSLLIVLVPLLALADVVVPDPATDLAGFVVFAATVWKEGGWVAGVGIGLMVLIAILRFVGERWFPFLSTRNGKLALAIVTAAVVGFLGGLAKGVGVAAAIGLALGAIPAAIGAFSITKNAAQPNTVR